MYSVIRGYSAARLEVVMLRTPRIVSGVARVRFQNACSVTPPVLLWRGRWWYIVVFDALSRDEHHGIVLKYARIDRPCSISSFVAVMVGLRS